MSSGNQAPPSQPDGAQSSSNQQLPPSSASGYPPMQQQQQQQPLYPPSLYGESSGYPPMQQQPLYPPSPYGESSGYPPMQQPLYPPSPYGEGDRGVAGGGYQYSYQPKTRQTLRFHMSATKLDNKDGLFGVSDPYVEILYGECVVAKSNTVMNNLNPTWQPIEVDIESVGGLNTQLLVRVMDYDDDGKHDIIGTTNGSLQELRAQQGKPIALARPKKSKKSAGTLTITKVEEATAQESSAYLVTFKATKLAKMDTFSSDPFLIVYGKSQSSQSNKLEPVDMAVIARTKYIKSNLNPTWEPILIEMPAAGGLDGQIWIRCFDWDSDLRHDLIGECWTTLRQLNQPSPLFPLRHPRKAESSGYKNSGILHVAAVEPAELGTHMRKSTAWEMTLSCQGLPSKGVFSTKIDPYILIKSNSGEKIFESEAVQNCKTPKYKPFVLTVNSCGGYDAFIFVEVWDKNKKEDEFIGAIRCSLRELLLFEKEPTWSLRALKNPVPGQLARKAGELHVLSCTPIC